MTHLGPKERAELRDLLDQLVEATEDNTHWPGQVRRTSVELRARLAEWLDEDGTESE